jgi:NitT/TauT family transport system permease protein
MATDPSTPTIAATPSESALGTASDPASTRVAGLDALELGAGQRADRTVGRLARAAWRSLWPKVLAVAIVIAAWQLVVLSQWKPEFVLPGPGRVFQELREEVTTEEFWYAIYLTMRRAVVGFFFAVVIGTVVGAAVAAFRPLRAAIGSLITGLQTMPSIIWFPFATLLFQFSDSAIMFVVILGAAPSVANGLISGIDYVPPMLRRVGTVLGMRGVSMYRHVILPASLPSFVSGLKQGWSFAWRSLMAGELLVIVAGQLSLGARLQGARDLNDAPSLVAFIVVVLLIGILVDIVFNAADNALRRRWGLVQTGG